MKKLIIALGALVVIVAFVFYMLRAPSTPEVTPGTPSADIPEGAIIITLTEDGFVPDKLSIAVGDTVAFVSKNDELFWPASNLHPSHSLYPEFDPKLPLQPEEAWSFTFTNAGVWQYHDHLAPYYTGVITVTE